MVEKNPPGAGDLEIELQGEGIVLRRTLGALIAFNRYNNRGGIYGAGGRDGLINHLGNSDVEAICFVVRQGLGVGPSAIKDLEERVFEEGAVNVASQLIPWVTSLAEGPMKPGDDDAGKVEGAGEGATEDPRRSSTGSKAGS